MDLTVPGRHPQLLFEPWPQLIDIVQSSTIQEHATILSKYTSLVESTIDLDALDRHDYAIKPEYNENLLRYSTTLQEARDDLDKEHKRVGKELGLELDKKLHLENNSVYGYCFRLSKVVSS